MQKLSLNNIDAKQLIKNTLIIIFGTVLLAFGTGVFLVPFNLVTGGMSGLAITLVNFIHVEFLTVDVYVTIMTWTLFVLGWIFLGTDFTLKTLVSAIVYPIALSLFIKLPSPDVMNGFFNLAGNSEYGEIALILSALFGGVFVGAGCAVTFRGGGSTGGTDIIAFIICKYFKKLKSSVVIFAVDAIIIILGILAIGDLVLCLVGIISAFVAALVIDKIFLGESQAFIAHIVSDKYKEINEAIIKKLDRTSTVLHATGGYSGTAKKVVMVSFTMRQYPDFVTYVRSIDKEAFITIHRAHEINGEGWTKNDLEENPPPPQGSLE